MYVVPRIDVKAKQMFERTQTSCLE
jgi:hypothetical protein